MAHASAGPTPEREPFAGFRRRRSAGSPAWRRTTRKAWFTAHRDTYDDEVRGALEAMLEELADELGGRVHLFRQHRDVRFSADKSPYKTTTYGLIVDRPGEPRGALRPALGRGALRRHRLPRLAADQLARFRDAVADDAPGPRSSRRSPPRRRRASRPSARR